MVTPKSGVATRGDYLMQTPALFKPMNLGEGFDDFDFGFSNDSVFYQPDVFDLPINIPTDFPTDAGLDLSLPENIATVDNSGNVNDQFGKRVISADAITNIALGNPGREGEAIAQTLKNVAPDWTKQFKDTDSLVKAAYALFNTTKAVVQGKPIPQNFQSPYVYNPNNPGVYNPSVYRPSTATSQLSMSSTNMLLIGGVALAAFLVLRKK
jgi:hypothetical protein